MLCMLAKGPSVKGSNGDEHAFHYCRPIQGSCQDSWGGLRCNNIRHTMLRYESFSKRVVTAIVNEYL